MARTLTDSQHGPVCEAIDELTADALMLAIDGKLVQARTQLSKAMRRLDEAMGARVAA